MDVVAKYRLVIAPSLNRFQNEIFYAFNYINRHYGVVIDEKSTRSIQYGGSDASMPSTFFEKNVKAIRVQRFARGFLTKKVKEELISQFEQ